MQPSVSVTRLARYASRHTLRRGSRRSRRIKDPRRYGIYMHQRVGRSYGQRLLEALAGGIAAALLCGLSWIAWQAWTSGYLAYFTTL